MNNFPDLYFDYVGATGENSITDYIDYTSNINYLYTSNSSNILENDILITSNILDNKTSNLRYELWEVNPNNSNCLIKSKKYNNKIHSYIINSNINGEIRFSTLGSYSSTNDPINDYSVKIDDLGKLYVYHKYNLLQPFFSAGFYDVEGEIFAIKNQELAFDSTLTGLQTYTQNFINIVSPILGLHEEQIFLLQNEIEMLGTVTNTDMFLIQGSQTYQSLQDNLVTIIQNSSFYNSGIASTGLTLAVSVGIPSVTFAVASSMSDYLNREYFTKIISNFSNSNIPSLTQEQKNILYSCNGQGYYNSLSNFNYSISNLSLSQGFINSNIISSQYINSINTNEIKMNNLNFSNIFVTSNVLNTTSNSLYNYTLNSSNNLINNIIFNSNINSNFIYNTSNNLINNIIFNSNINSNYTYNTSNNLINNIIYNSNINSNYTYNTSNNLNNNIIISSNNITYNTSNLLFNTNYTIERPYPPKLYNSSTSQSVVTYLNQTPTYYETFTLTTADITYGSGTYEVRSSSIDDTTISYTGTGSTSNIITGNTNYSYVIFPNSGTFTINNSLICDILIVGGGGGGGGFGGGGGAGAILFAQNYTIPSGTHTITVGTGGAGAPRNTNGTNGNNSSITISGTSYIAVGGGGGGSRIETGSPLYGRPGNNGGSGGGGGHSDGITTPQNNLGGTSTKNTYSGWTSYGNTGGNGKNGDYVATGYGSGGGGGAGSIGTNAGNNSGGNGGTGINMNSYFGSVVGNNGWFGGGGGGAAYSGRAGYINGYGNGGNGNFGGGGNAFSVNGLANTGGGGGGADYNNGSGNGGTGGSGVVIIRFLNPTITTKKELFNLITNDSGCTFKSNQYNISNGNYLTTDRYINNYYGDWIIIKKPNPVFLIKYRIYNRPSFIERAPSLFKIFASTDGITYDEITEASNTTALTTSNYSLGYFEKIVNYYSKAYSYFALVVNKIIGGNINSHLLNFTEFQIFGKEIINYIPIYSSSNAVKDIIILDTPNVNKKFAFYCQTTNVIYINGGSTAYYAYHINLTNYTKTGYIQIGGGSNDPYRIFNIKMFFGSCYFEKLTNGIPDICEYNVYMSNKAAAGGSGTKAGINIMATGFPENYTLDKIMPNNLFLMKNGNNNFNYITVVTTSQADVRVFIEDMLN